MTADLKIDVYTDGACRGNPGPGGWGVLFIVNDETETLCGGAPETTNNRMELQAAIEALKALPEGTTMTVYTDSLYVKDGISKWIVNWRKNNWKNGRLKNKDLWVQLDELNLARNVTWQWVRGHAGHPLNEKADELANIGLNKAISSSSKNIPTTSMTALANELSDIHNSLYNHTKLLSNEEIHILQEREKELKSKLFRHL